MGATNIDITILIKKQQVEKVRKYVPTFDNEFDYETAATHGLIDGKLYAIVERGEFFFGLSNHISYQKNNKNITWLRLYEIDYENINFPTW